MKGTIVYSGPKCCTFPKCPVFCSQEKSSWVRIKYQPSSKTRERSHLGVFFLRSSNTFRIFLALLHREGYTWLSLSQQLPFNVPQPVGLIPGGFCCSNITQCATGRQGARRTKLYKPEMDQPECPVLQAAGSNSKDHRLNREETLKKRLKFRFKFQD